MAFVEGDDKNTGLRGLDDWGLGQGFCCGSYLSEISELEGK